MPLSWNGCTQHSRRLIVSVVLPHVLTVGRLMCIIVYICHSTWEYMFCDCATEDPIVSGLNRISIYLRQEIIETQYLE